MSNPIDNLTEAEAVPLAAKPGNDAVHKNGAGSSDEHPRKESAEINPELIKDVLRLRNSLLEKEKAADKARLRADYLAVGTLFATVLLVSATLWIAYESKNQGQFETGDRAVRLTLSAYSLWSQFTPSMRIVTDRYQLQVPSWTPSTREKSLKLLA